MSEWKTFKLGQIADVQNGFAFKSEDFTSNGIPVIKIRNIASGRLIMDELNYYSKYVDLLSNYLISKDDILISMTGSHIIQISSAVAKVTKYTDERVALLNQRVGKIFPKDKGILNNDFLYYYLIQPRIQFELGNSATGSANQANISPNQIKNLIISTPPIGEQKIVASIFRNLDSKIDLLRSQNETLEQIAQTLFKHWFVDFEFPDENGQPYKSSGGEMVDSEFGEIPKEWIITQLSTEIDVLRGLSYKGGGLCDSDIGVPMHNLKSVFEGGGYQHSGIKYYKNEYKSRHLCKAGDLIVPNTEQGEKHKLIGFPARIPSYYSDISIYTHHLFKIDFKHNSLTSPEYLFYLLTSKKMRHQIISYTNGTTVNMLPADGLQKPIFPIPTKNLVLDFSGIIQPMWNQFENNIKGIDSITKIRDLLLPKLMSGQIRIIE